MIEETPRGRIGGTTFMQIESVSPVTTFEVAGEEMLTVVGATGNPDREQGKE
jgi:hypothetical protein